MVVRPGQRIVAPLTGNAVMADNDLPPNDQTPADPSAKNYAEHQVRVRAGTVNRLGKGKTICVILKTDRPSQ